MVHMCEQVLPKMWSILFVVGRYFTTQNVTAIVDFDLCFTYVLTGWERSAHDATVLADALSQGVDEFIIPEVSGTT